MAVGRYKQLREKNVFNEKFLIHGMLDQQSKVNLDLVKNHILINFMKKNIYQDDQYWYMSDYFKIPYHQHIQWIQDWFRDHYFAEYGQSLIPTSVDSIRGQVIQSGESVNSHHNVKDTKLDQSPDVDVLFCLAAGSEKELSNCVFEFDNGRQKHRRWKVDMRPKRFFMFSSEIPRYVTRNKSKDFIVNLSLHFQIL